MSKRKSDASTETVGKKSCQRFKDTYRQLWPCLNSSRKGATHVFCSVCNCDFSCAHAGRNDCRRHIESKQHADYKKLKSENRTITSFCAAGPTEPICAEVMMCEFLAEQNLPLATADKMCKTVKKMFPDSKIAAAMKCGRNKATAIICDLADITKTTLAERMRTGPFTVSTDGSNDDMSKQFPLVVRTLDPSTLTVNSELLSIPVCNEAATGENIFKLIDNELGSRSIPWSNCLSLGCDNANVMVGHKKGVFAFVKEKQPQVYLSGCCLHLIHIAARNAAKSLPAIEDVLIDIYYYFNKSDKRKSEFKGTQEIYDIDQKRMLKHVCTRWLSIGRCIVRLIHNWDALKIYFKAQKDIIDAKRQRSSEKVTKKATTKNTEKVVGAKTTAVAKSTNVEFEKVYMEPSYAEKKISAVFEFVKSPTNKLYVLFLSYSLKMFDEILLSLQADDPKIHILQRALCRLLRSVLVRFVKPSAMSGKLEEVDYRTSYNIKSNQDLVIGEDAKAFIEQSVENHLRKKRVDEFYENVVVYYQAACDDLKRKLPLNEPLLHHAEVADVRLQQSAKVASLVFFIDKFPCLLSGVSKDQLVQQFVEYQSHDVSSCIRDRIDDTWREIGGVADENGNKLFAGLAMVMLGIVTIPHSSAHCERVFSTVRKNRTDQRYCLKDRTLEALLILKARPGHSTDRDHSRETLATLKGAYYRSLKD